MKYNNGELDANDLFELYAETKQFANTANEYLPSRNEISNAYRTLKSKLIYFRNFINNNRPSGQNPLQETIIPTVRQQRQQPPPAPTPSSNNQAPAPPQNSPDPPPTQQQPTPVPTPSPTLSNIINAITPETTPQNLAIGAMATLGSGAVFLNRMAIMRNERQIERLQGENILNRARNVAEAGLGQAIGNQLQQAAENTLQNIRNARQTIENIENRQRQTASAERNLNPRRERPPLRQRTIDTNARARLRDVQVRTGPDEFATVALDEEEAQQELAEQLGGEAINVPQTPQSVREIMEISRASRGDDRPITEQDIQTEIRRNQLAEQMSRQDPDTMRELYEIEPRTLEQRRSDIQEQLDFS